MTSGKSVAGYILAQAWYEHDNNVRIGCPTQEVYDRMSVLIPKENLIKTWEQSDDVLFWYGDLE